MCRRHSCSCQPGQECPAAQPQPAGSDRMIPVWSLPELLTTLISAFAASRWLFAKPRAAPPNDGGSRLPRWRTSHDASSFSPTRCGRPGRPVTPPIRPPPTWRTRPSAHAPRVTPHRSGNGGKPPRQSLPARPTAAANQDLDLAGGRSAAAQSAPWFNR
jgi:hypothetical protein